MTWSLGETAALSQKAARGGGLSWGLAEEAAAAVIWLHTRGLPGVSALCRYLEDGDKRPPADGACPILTGAALMDGALPRPKKLRAALDLGAVRTPLLLLPFTVQLGDGNVWLLTAAVDGRIDAASKITQTKNFLHDTSPCHLQLADVEQLIPPRKDGETLTRLPDAFSSCIDRLTRFARRTYAPATRHSRHSGAGAGLTDND